MVSVEKEDVESIKLLQKISTDSLITGHTNEGDILDERTKSIKCVRCGFINNSKSTVCKECNSLLKEDIIMEKKKIDYYWLRCNFMDMFVHVH